MAWQSDRNVGPCQFRACKAREVARCDGFYCEECCIINHADWSGHRQPDGHVVPVAQRPFNANHSTYCVCLSCKSDKAKKEKEQEVPVDWDYDGHPPEFNEIKELGDDYERVFIPVSNYRANKDWPVDYTG